MSWHAMSSHNLARRCVVVAALVTGVAGCASDETASPSPSESPIASAPAAVTVPAALTLSTMEPGDIAQTVAPVVQPTAAPVPIDAPATFTSGVVASITDVTAVTTEAAVPGELAGPGVSISVEVANRTDDPIDLGSALLDLVDASGASATPITSGSAPLTGTLAPGESASGTYVFTIDDALRRDVTIQLSYSAGEPIVVFAGDLD